MNNFFLRNWKYIVIFILGIILGFYIGHIYFPKIEYKTSEANVATGIVLKDTTEIQYVPKTSSNDSDVEINKEQPKVSVSVNGQKYSFDLLQNESQKFDKGKIVANQTTSLNVDVTAEVNKQIQKGIQDAFKQQNKSRFELGIGYSNHGYAGLAEYDFNNTIGVWGYVDKDTKTGGIKGKF
jgi:hypothetical protein